jgi:prefoldin subunit 5
VTEEKDRQIAILEEKIQALEGTIASLNYELYSISE